VAAVKDLLSIGRFSQLSGLTVRAVRHYGELELLPPAWVDDETGYRYYASRQLVDAEAIKRLRSLELPLDEIREILRLSDDAVRERLAEHRERLLRQAETTNQILHDLNRLIDGKEPLVPAKTITVSEVDVQELPEQHVLRIRQQATMEELPRLIGAAIEELEAHMKSVGTAEQGPVGVAYAYPDETGVMRFDTYWPVEAGAEGAGRIEAVTMPACIAISYLHRGPYDELHHTHSALHELLSEHGAEPAGDAREVYLTDPRVVPDPADYETLVQFPVVPETARVFGTPAAAGR
jgi:effector-binding domain-containing protein